MSVCTMRLKGLTAVLIGLSVLCLVGCASTKQATSSHSEQLKVESVEFRDSLNVERVELKDTLREVTTITVQTNDKGDTLKVVQITDLTRARSRDNVVAQRVKTEVRFQDSSAGRASPFVSALKWIFWILIGLIGLIITVKVCSLRR